jgi:hypothetical protein
MPLVDEFADEFQLLLPQVRAVADFDWPAAYLFCQVSGAGVFLARREQDCARF